MDSTALVLAVVALIAGLAIGYLLALVRARSLVNDDAAGLAAARARLATLEDALGTQREDAAARLSDAERRHLRMLAEAEERHAEEVERIRADGEVRLADLREDTQRLADEFDALSRRALAANNEAFLAQAEERLKRSQSEQTSELEQREEAVRAMVDPLATTLSKVREELVAAESSRVAAHAALAQEVRGMKETSEALRTETGALVTALRSPQVRGQWGELQLRRTVEAAGMVEHVDFAEQVRLEDGELRPDLVVSLPGAKRVVVDSKVAFNGYLEAMEARDDATRRARLAAHARHLRTHIDSLSRKEYWAHVEGSPEFTVMFVPSQVFLDAALEQDPSLLEYAFEKDVVLATPATLVALLRTVAYTWRQEQLAAEAAQVFQVGRELHKRLAIFGAHLDKVARRLNDTVTAFNAMTSSLDSRVVPQIQRFSALQGLDAAAAVPKPLEVQAIPAHKPDLHEPASA
ncbi:DNA recombination protein RmuC [Salana multivorans]